MMNKKADFTKELITVDESMREIASLSELYEDLVNSSPRSKAEAESAREQAEFARERILKLSLLVKNTLEKAETHEHVTK
jgi:hypothetical protein